MATRLVTRTLAGLLIGGMAIVIVGFFWWQATTRDGNLLAPLAIGAPYGLLGFAMWRRIFHPRLTAGPEGLILRGQWRTVRVPWSAVAMPRHAPPSGGRDRILRGRYATG